MLVHAVVPFPSELVNAAAGLRLRLLGRAPARARRLAAVRAGDLRDRAQRGAAAAAALRRARSGWRRARGWSSAAGVTALLAARLVPIVPYSAVGYVAGAAQVPLWRFAWTTVVGSVPLCAAVVYLGHRLDSLSPTDPGVLVAVGAFLLAAGGRAHADPARPAARAPRIGALDLRPSWSLHAHARTPRARSARRRRTSRTAAGRPAPVGAPRVLRGVAQPQRAAQVELAAGVQSRRSRRPRSSAVPVGGDEQLQPVAEQLAQLVDERHLLARARRVEQPERRGRGARARAPSPTSA